MVAVSAQALRKFRTPFQNIAAYSISLANGDVFCVCKGFDRGLNWGKEPQRR